MKECFNDDVLHPRCMSHNEFEELLGLLEAQKEILAEWQYDKYKEGLTNIYVSGLKNWNKLVTIKKLLRHATP